MSIQANPDERNPLYVNRNYISPTKSYFNPSFFKNLPLLIRPSRREAMGWAQVQLDNSRLDLEFFFGGGECQPNSTVFGVFVCVFSLQRYPSQQTVWYLSELKTPPFLCCILKKLNCLYVGKVIKHRRCCKQLSINEFPVSQIRLIRRFVFFLRNHQSTRSRGSL